tara:strand:- start:6323 stop:6445 length:123 start_codon:yes stop_codon:yes gene_type:complete
LTLIAISSTIYKKNAKLKHQPKLKEHEAQLRKGIANEFAL